MSNPVPELYCLPEAAWTPDSLRIIFLTYGNFWIKVIKLHANYVTLSGGLYLPLNILSSADTMKCLEQPHHIVNGVR